jgi:L-lactate dehydrogenase complex protein LldG
MNARDSILARVREALRGGSDARVLRHLVRHSSGTRDEGGSETAADLSRHSQAAADAAEPKTQPTDGSIGVRRVLPKVPGDFAGQVALFAERSDSLKTELVPCADEAAASAQLKLLSDREGWESIAYPGDSEIRTLLSNLSIPKLPVDRSTVKTDLAKVSAGITGCDALIAQTGSVLLTANSGGGRALSVLPLHHVVVAWSSQLVPDLPAAFELLEQKYAPNFPSFMTFITGPSRTGDIERVLVLGAHGPRKLTVILVGSEETTSEPVATSCPP